MCKKKAAPEQPAFTDRTISAFVVGDFPGTQNDLEGPPLDAIDFRKKIESIWPDITFRKHADSYATKHRLLSEIAEAISHVGPDGMLLFIMDTCHAESSTRNGRPKLLRGKGMLRGLGYDKVLVFSSALANQTAADAQFPGGANGAWHYALEHTVAEGITYKEWFERAKAMIKQMGFSQIPVMEGPEELQNRLVFEGNIEVVEVSSHGGQVPDRDGDEPDRLDEVIYTYDSYVKDDEIRALIEDLRRGRRGIKIRLFLRKVGEFIGLLR